MYYVAGVVVQMQLLLCKMILADSLQGFLCDAI